MNVIRSTELDALDGLALRAEAMAPRAQPFLAPWKAELEKCRHRDDLDTLAGERALDELAGSLRSAWLRAAHDATVDLMMSPPHEQPKTMPSGMRFQFDYERSNRPEVLERRGLQGPPPGWGEACQLYSSGMAAIAALLRECCARLHGPIADRPVQLDMFGGYFETWRLLDTVHDAVMRVEYLTSSKALEARIAARDTDAVLLEPVAYDWDMTVFDLEGFAKAWAAAGDGHPRLVIVDTSLSGPAFSMDTLLPAFGDRLPWMVAFVRSGLKLDQEGLELSNVGVVNLFVPDGDASPVSLERLRDQLIVHRGISGGGLSVYQTAALEAPWCFDAEAACAHAARVFANNASLAKAILLSGGVFSHVHHPILSGMADKSWAVAPFVVLHLSEAAANDCGKLVAILVHEVRERGLNFDLASSFGFRGDRFEIIRPLVQIREYGASAGLLKIAMGSRGGPTMPEVIKLANEIAAYPDWTTLRDAYAHVPPYVKTGLGVYVAKPPRS